MGEHLEQRLDPGEEVLAVWRSWVDAAAAGRWGDVRNRRNSILDSEFLNCLLMPQMDIAGLDLSDLDEVETGIYEVLRPLASSAGDREVNHDGCCLPNDVLETLTTTLLAYFNEYQHDGQPHFLSGGYAASESGRDVEVVDSYTLATAVSVNTLYLTDQWITQARGTDRYRYLSRTWEDLRNLADRRLTAAMTGLVGSFSVNTECAQEWREKTGIPWDPSRMRDLVELRTRLSALGEQIGPHDAFECGWSWGQPPVGERRGFGGDFRVDTVADFTLESRGNGDLTYAASTPYLYFTMTAVNAIASLFTSKVQAAEVLDGTQLYLASRLRYLWETTSRFWATLASAETDDGQLVIENIPWRTSDGTENDYYTLYIVGLLAANLARGVSSASEALIERFTSILEELAQRARVTRRPVPADRDPSVRATHYPGFSVELRSGAEDGVLSAQGTWQVYDMSPSLLRCTANLLQVVTSQENRDRLVTLRDAIWRHLAARRSDTIGDHGGRSSSWDDLSGVYSRMDFDVPHWEDSAQHSVHSWYYTQRVIEALVGVARSKDRRLPDTPQLDEITPELLSELDWMISRHREQDPDGAERLRQLSSWARDRLRDRPALAFSIATKIGQELAGSFENEMASKLLDR